MQVQTLSDVSQRLQSSLADTTKAHQAERLKRDNLHKQVMPHLCLATLLELANACTGDMNKFCQKQAAALLDVARPATKQSLLTFKLLRIPLADSIADTRTIYTGNLHIYSISSCSIQM